MVRRLSLIFLIFVCISSIVFFFYGETFLKSIVSSYKGEIEKLLSDSLHAEVSIGELVPQLSPFPELRADNVVINGLPSQTESLNVSRVIFRIKLLPLLSHKFRFRKVHVEIPVYHYLAPNGGIIAINDLKLDCKLDFEGSQTTLRNLDLTATLNGLPIELSGNTTYFTSSSGLLQLEGAALKIGSSHADVSGFINFQDQKVEFKFPNFSLEPSALKLLLAQISADFGNFIQRGTITGSLHLAGSTVDALQVSGTVSITGPLSGTNFAIGDSTLMDISLDFAQGSFSRLKTTASISKLHYADTREIYNTGLENGTFEFIKMEPEKYLVSGDLEIKDFTYDDRSIKSKMKDSKTQQSSFKDTVLKSFSLELNSGSITYLKTQLTSSQLHVVSAKEIYEATSLHGGIELKRVQHGKTSGHEILGNLGVKGFGFSDDVTTIKEVNAELTPIHISINKTGDATASVMLNSNSLKLKNDSVEIFGAQKISVPLVVVVPNSGGYKISGPLAISGAEIEAVGQRFQKVGGTTDILVSSPLKSFTSKKLDFVLGNIPSRLTVVFKIFPDEYSLVSAETDILAGTLELKGGLERGTTKNFALRVAAKNLDNKRISSFIDPNSIGEVAGTVDALTLDVKGVKDSFPQSLVGTGEVSISQPKGRASFLARKIYQVLRSVPVVKDIFGSKDDESVKGETVFGKFRFADGTGYVDSAQLSRSNYNVVASGKIGFDKKLDLRGEVVLLQEAASNLGLGIGPLKRLFGRIGRIVVPIFIRGSFSDVQIEADITTFIKNNSGIGLGENVLKGMRDAIF